MDPVIALMSQCLLVLAFVILVILIGLFIAIYVYFRRGD